MAVDAADDHDIAASRMEVAERTSAFLPRPVTGIAPRRPAQADEIEPTPRHGDAGSYASLAVRPLTLICGVSPFAMTVDVIEPQ